MKMGTDKGNWWKRLKGVLKTHTSLAVIIAAALLIELVSGVMYYAAQDIIYRLAGRVVESEMNTICLNIRYETAKVTDNGGGGSVAVADLPPGWINTVMNQNKLYQSTLRFLVTGSHDMLAGEDSPTYRAVMEHVQSQKGNFTMRDGQGRMKQVYYTPVGGNTDWLLICVLDDGEVFGKLRTVRLFLLTLVLASLLLIGFIVWRTSRNLERLRKVNAEKERISSELRVASRIQQSMLPHSHLARDDVEIFGQLVPVREVGGDLFDYFIRDEKLFFCIGDVSGKGTPSAILMASTCSLFRAFSTHEDNPAQIMRAVNEAACKGNDANMFVTLFIGVLDLPTGHLWYCNAGHDAPVVLNAQSSVNTLEVAPHLPVGLFDDFKYNMQEAFVSPGSTIFLYTDGLTEAMDNEHQQFGMKRVEEVMAVCGGLQPQQTIERVSREVHRFVGDAEQSDDLTMLAIKLEISPKPQL